MDTLQLAKGLRATSLAWTIRIPPNEGKPRVLPDLESLSLPFEKTQEPDRIRFQRNPDGTMTLFILRDGPQHVDPHTLEGLLRGFCEQSGMEHVSLGDGPHLN
jgi:hypothetical protein